MTVIKNTERNVLFDVNYDEDLGRFIIWEQNKPNFQGVYINENEMKDYINTKQIEIINDSYNIIKTHIQ